MKICIISTYTPEKCGIAEYANELAHALINLGIDVSVIAVNQGVERLIYPEIVEFVIRRDNIDDYREAAEYVNVMDVDAVILQHEYGIFGGRWGNYVLELLSNIKVPVLTTLHTVINPFDENIKALTEHIVRMSDIVTVMSRNALNILKRHYNVDADNHIYVVPHGVKTIYVGSREEIRKKLGISNNFVILTIGLLGPDKGIEYGIKALPDIVKHIDNALYMIVGEVHPKLNIRKAYRKKLKKLVKKLGLKDNVVFIEKFLSKRDYVKYIVASDVVLLPYVNKMQASSGALSYALSYGRAIVSTPFIYAEEMLSNNRGILCKFKDPKSIAKAIIRVATEPELRTELEAKALEFGVRLRWEYVSLELLSLIANIVKSKHREEVRHYVTPTYSEIS